MTLRDTDYSLAMQEIGIIRGQAKTTTPNCENATQCFETKLHERKEMDDAVGMSPKDPTMRLLDLPTEYTMSSGREAA
ncbi:hypothetical protein HYALB_00006338 [Hymenoscyphus albidus]|uniref:Uncharacterized protein n=1 Tax=Hymenoscyphus albidus TaxID=595503 RepID=A0A9N9LGV1_9HELO|nr:hypothetical protein HYALB_00006338 [Hymenoscyphus albidus]